MVGYMAMPADFKYKDIFLKGHPISAGHPRMDNVRRAKLFSSFNALAGFSSAVTAKEELYEERRELSPSDLEELDGKQLATKHITVEYFVPCRDRNNSWYGKGGQYVAVSGVCRKVDPVCRTIALLAGEEKVISFEDIYRIEEY